MCLIVKSQSLLIVLLVNTTMKILKRKEELCKDSPVPNLQVIMPESDNEDHGYCSCTLYDVLRCNCLQENNFLGVYNRDNEDNSTITICWKNITNNISLHFVTQVYPLDSSDLPPTRNIMASCEVVIAGKIMIDFLKTKLYICISP